MKITYDDQYLVTVAEDASIILWKIQDKEGRGLKRDKEVGWAEEILITKSDLEEKVRPAQPGLAWHGMSARSRLDCSMARVCIRCCLEDASCLVNGLAGRRGDGWTHTHTYVHEFMHAHKHNSCKHTAK